MNVVRVKLIPSSGIIHHVLFPNLILTLECVNTLFDVFIPSVFPLTPPVSFQWSVRGPSWPCPPDQSRILRPIGLSDRWLRPGVFSRPPFQLTPPTRRRLPPGPRWQPVIPIVNPSWLAPFLLNLLFELRRPCRRRQRVVKSGVVGSLSFPTTRWRLNV